MQELQPITIELIRGLRGYDRTIAIKNYHIWLESIRNKERQQHRKECISIINFIRKGKIKEWKLKHKKHLKEYQKRYHATKTKKILRG